MSNIHVPFLDVGAAYQEIRAAADVAVERVLSSGWYILGPEVERFEQEWATYCGASHCAGVGSGLDALVLGLRALDIGPGDEVIVPSNTFIASWLAISEVGAEIVPVEPDINSLNITPEAIDVAITPRTAAIMPVHLYGLPVDIHGIEALARRRGLPVIYDAAQAHGARVAGKPIGSYGTLSAWSFFPGKNLGALGDGGAVTSNDPSIIQRIRSLRNYGSEEKYVHLELGVNSRLDELQAALLQTKIAYLDGWNQHRAKIASLYRRSLVNLGLHLPIVPDGVESAWHLFVVRSEFRDKIREDLSAKGIQTGVHYPTPPHLQPAYRHRGFPNLPIAEMLSKTVLSLPIGPHCNFEQAHLVIENLRLIMATYDCDGR